MKKTGFLAGAAISTIGIVLCKIIGLVYVIPFYALIGTQGGALYSYAYSIYNIFLNLATSGIPVAMSKVVSEYNELKYYNTKERAFKIGLKIISILCILSFLALFIFAPVLADKIIGNVKGGNTTSDVTMVIRVISTAILVVPHLSVSKGYLQGHKIMQVSSIADVLEQLVRVAVILFGSYFTLKILKLPLRVAVAVSVFAATIGAFVSYLYVRRKINGSKSLNRGAKKLPAEVKVTNKVIGRKIILVAMPFVIISLLEALFSNVDVFTVVKGLTGLGYTTKISENVVSVISTWGSKLNMIVMAVSTGIITSLIPTIASSYISGNMKEVNIRVNQALQILCLVIVPLSVGMSFMSKSVWTVFYGYSDLNSSIFSLLILSQIPLAICSILVNTNQAMTNTRATVTALVGSLILKFSLNVPFMHLFYRLGFEAYYATIWLNILIDGVESFYLMHKVREKTNISFKSSFISLLKIILCTTIMVLGLSILNLIIPNYSHSRFLSIIYIIIYGVVGALIYFIMAYKSNAIDEIVGNKNISKFLSRFSRKRKNVIK